MILNSTPSFISKKMAERVVILRFSALGDIALLVPVVQALQQAHPQLSITVVSRPFAAALFSPLAVHFYPVQLQNYSGLQGLWRLSKELKYNIDPDVILDMHNVLRTKVIRQYFSLKGRRVAVIDKGRAEKKQLTRKNNKRLKPLRHSAERYAEVCVRGGFPLQFDPQDVPVLHFSSPRAQALFAEKCGSCNVGIAPLAKHRAKEWPREKWQQLMQHPDNKHIHWWLLGAPDEVDALQELLRLSQCSGTVLAGTLKLNEEIALMQQLDAVIALDSSNMHLATLAAVPVISIWGATHPYLGFRPLGAQNQQYIVQMTPDELSCRPCSTFGQKPCWRGDYACLQNLPEERVQKTLSTVLKVNI